MKSKIASIILVFFAQIFYAQERTANLKIEDTDGFHRILISPEILSATANNMDFIRILDSKKNEVPYVLFKKQSSTKSVKTFDIISKNPVSNKFTDFVIINKDVEKLDQISLKIANTEVEKRYNISGSNDQKEWFGLVDNQFIDGLYDPKSTFVTRDFYFPLNQYKYLKFTFLDKYSLPINVMEAFSEASFQTSTTPILLDNFTQKISQNKETKQTIISIKFNEFQIVDAFKIDVSSPGFYSRNVSVSVPKIRTYKKRTETFSESIANFQISSKIDQMQKISGVFSKEFVVTIDNQDNAPLEIGKLNFYQNPISILADLKKGENYKVIINPKLSEPKYDLAQSGINFNADFPEARIDNLDKITDKKTLNADEAFWQKPIFMWICILLAIAIIGFFAIGMVKDLNKN